MRYDAVRNAIGMFVSVMLTGGIGAASDFSTSSISYREQLAFLQKDVRNTRLVHSLAVNREEEFRLVVPNKCETEGELELQLLSAKALVEESYVFIPGLCLWLEVGVDETTTSVRLDQSFIRTVLGQFPSAIFYHIQPSNRLSVQSHFPSYSDLLTLVLINALSVTDHGVRARHRAVMRLGTVEYALSNETQVSGLIQKYRDIGLRGYEAQNLAYEYRRPKYRNEYYEKVRKCDVGIGTAEEKMRRCCPIKTSAFVLNFRPLTAIVGH